jgi:hypothetical protein
MEKLSNQIVIDFLSFMELKDGDPNKIINLQIKGSSRENLLINYL